MTKKLPIFFAFLSLLLGGMVSADDKISVLCRKFWMVDSTSVCVTPKLEREMLAQFNSEILQDHISNFNPSKDEIHPSEVLQDGEIAELRGIQKAFKIFSASTHLPKVRTGLFESLKVLAGLKAYDCFSMSGTVFRFLKWLEKNNRLHYFNTTESSWRGNPTVHVATPIRRKKDRSIWVVDAWWKEGEPKIFSEKAFVTYVHETLEALEPGPKF